MALNHDNFIASANYIALDASLQWYMDTLGPKRSTLENLAKTNLPAFKAMYQRDPVLKKLRKISEFIQKMTDEIAPETTI